MTFAIVYVLCAGGRVPAESDASATARVEAMPLLGSVRSSVLPPPFVQCLTRPVQLRGAVDHPDADVRGALVSVGGGPDAAYVDSHQVRGAPHAVSGVLCCAVLCRVRARPSLSALRVRAHLPSLKQNVLASVFAAATGVAGP